MQAFGAWRPEALSAYFIFLGQLFWTYKVMIYLLVVTSSKNIDHSSGSNSNIDSRGGQLSKVEKTEETKNILRL